MDCTYCLLPDEKRLSSNLFVTSVYEIPENNKYTCNYCGNDQSKVLGQVIFKALHNPNTTTSALDEIRLCAACYSLTGYWHVGLNPEKPEFFYIKGVVESASGIVVTLCGEDKKEMELAESVEGFLSKMTLQELRDTDLEEISSTSVRKPMGGKAPSLS